MSEFSPISPFFVNIGPASATAPGFVTTGAQTFAGDKTFTVAVTIDGGTGAPITIAGNSASHTASASLRTNNTGSTVDVILNPYGSGSIYLNFDSGDGGVYFSNGASATVGHIDASGNLSANGNGGFGAYIRTTGVGTLPATGAGLELVYSGGGQITAYDRGTSAYESLVLNGSSISLNPGGTAALACDSTGTKIGPSPTAITNVATYAPSLSGGSAPIAVAANTTSLQSFTIAGLATNDLIGNINPPVGGLPIGLGIIGAWVYSANTLIIGFVNATAGPLTPPAGVYSYTAIRS